MSIDVGELTFIELYKLSSKVNWEMFTRIWWIPASMFVVGCILYWLGVKYGS